MNFKIETLTHNHTKMKKFEDFTVSEIVRADFRARTVFRKFGIDINLNKTKTINEICVNSQLDPETLLDEIIEQMEVKVTIPVYMTA